MAEWRVLLAPEQLTRLVGCGNDRAKTGGVIVGRHSRRLSHGRKGDHRKDYAQCSAERPLEHFEHGVHRAPSVMGSASVTVTVMVCVVCRPSLSATDAEIAC